MPKRLLLCSGILWGLPGKCGPGWKVEADPESITFGISQDGKFFLERRLQQWAHSHHHSDRLRPNILNLGLLLATSHLTG